MLNEQLRMKTEPLLLTLQVTFKHFSQTKDYDQLWRTRKLLFKKLRKPLAIYI